MSKAILLVPGATEPKLVDFPSREQVVSSGESNLSLYYSLIGCSMISVGLSLKMGDYEAVIVIDDEGLYRGPVGDDGLRMPALYNALASGLVRNEYNAGPTSPIVGTGLIVQGDDDGNLFGFGEKELAEVMAKIDAVDPREATPRELEFIANFV
jgi:hypothetical protein